MVKTSSSILLLLLNVSCAKTETKGSDIRSYDFEKYLVERDPLGNTPDCPGAPLQRLEVQYGKLLNDNSEQAVVEATTCEMGNGGADIVEVFRLDSSGTPISLPIDDSGYTKGELYEGHMRTPRLKLINRKLKRWFVTGYKGPPGKPENGFEREIFYRWSGHSFVIENVVDTPFEKSAE